MTFCRALLAAAIIGGIGQTTDAAPPGKHVEIRVGDKTYQGVVAAHNENDFWLLERDGRLDAFLIQDVSQFEPLPGRMRPFTAGELRDRLVREFGQNFEVIGSRHYLVVAPKGHANDYADLFEELYRHTYVYFTARRFHIHEPEFPLMAIVFPDRDGFAAYCVQEKVNPLPGLMGYYMPSSNRVALFDSTTSGGSVAGLDATVIHEAVHQAAFNLGLHRRIGDNPLWMVEGLAMTFEPENFRNPAPATPPAARINVERYARYRNLPPERRQTHSLEELVKDDQLFKTATLDAYAQSWALTFYLLQTREMQYSQYLKLVNARPALAPYEPEDRLADFRKAFGNDLNQLDLELARYMNGLRE